MKQKCWIWAGNNHVSSCRPPCCTRLKFLCKVILFPTNKFTNQVLILNRITYKEFVR